MGRIYSRIAEAFPLFSLSGRRVHLEATPWSMHQPIATRIKAGAKDHKLRHLRMRLDDRVKVARAAVQVADAEAAVLNPRFHVLVEDL